MIHFANDDIEAILAPERGGRLMHYSRVGESNLLWTVRDINKGQGDVYGWRNWGGEKTWIWPQTDWPVHPNGETWPPPHDMEQAPFTIIMQGDATKHGHEPGHIIIMGQRSIMRVLRFPAKGTQVDIHASLDQHPQACGIWSVTQIPVPKKIEIERVEPNRFLAQAPDSKTPLAMLDANTVDLANTSGGSKGMMDANAFRVPTAQGTLVVRQDEVPNQPYGDIHRAIIYKSIDRDGDAYVELEFVAPLVIPLGYPHVDVDLYRGSSILPSSSQRVTLSLE